MNHDHCLHRSRRRRKRSSLCMTMAHVQRRIISLEARKEQSPKTTTPKVARKLKKDDLASGKSSLTKTTNFKPSRPFSAKRHALKTQKSFKVGCLSRRPRTPIFKKDDVKELVIVATEAPQKVDMEEENRDFFLEIYSKDRQEKGNHDLECLDIDWEEGYCSALFSDNADAFGKQKNQKSTIVLIKDHDFENYDESLLSVTVIGPSPIVGLWSIRSWLGCLGLVRKLIKEPLTSEELWWNWRKLDKEQWSRWQKKRPDAETVFLKAMAETGQIKLYGEQPTLTETALYRARKHLYKEERLQAEHERLGRDGPVAYYSERVKAWKKDISREAIQKHYEETGEDENTQLIEMFSCQTAREYRVMMGTDHRISRDPLAM
ncbi:protein plastid transcriptionally active 12, chloroplastic [Tanacetum coccineum]